MRNSKDYPRSLVHFIQRIDNKNWTRLIGQAVVIPKNCILILCSRHRDKKDIAIHFVSESHLSQTFIHILSEQLAALKRKSQNTEILHEINRSWLSFVAKS